MWDERKTPFTTSYTGQSGVLASQNPLSEKFPEISEMFWQEQGNSSCELLTMTMLPLQSVRSIQPQHSIYRWGELSTGFICNSQCFTLKDVWLARLMKGLTHIILEQLLLAWFHVFQFNTNVNISEENIKVFYLQMLLIYFHILKWNEIPVNVNMLPGRFWHHTNLSSSYCFTWKTLVWTRIRQVKCSVCAHVVWEFSVITDVWKPLRSTQCSQMEYLQHAAILY